MDRYGKEELKIAARGQWKSILASIGGVSMDLIDGNHHPCPKCGGVDRFRMIDDQEGALHCNQCFSTKNGDGIAAIMWLLDCKFTEAVTKIGQHLGLKPIKKSRKKDPAAHLKFVEWNDLLAAGWCLKKKPIKPHSLKICGARMAIYRDRHKVIALPVWSGSPDNIVGWSLYNVTGGTLPKVNPVDKTISQVKVKLTYGSQAGIIGWIDPESKTIFKTEGPSDLLALISLGNFEGSAICNANGAKENPANRFGWLHTKICAGTNIFVIHDCDQPGQEGATKVGERAGWATWLASTCTESDVKNVVLPYPIEETHGKDLRDFISDGHGFGDLMQLAADADPIQSTEIKSSPVWEADDDPHRLARVNLNQYQTKHGGRLVFWRDEWWKYKLGRYTKIGNKELRSKINASIRSEFESCWRREQEEDDEPKPIRKVNESLVTNVIAAMASWSYLPDSTPMPSWLPNRNKDRNLISMQNGILDLDAIFELKPPDECLLDHTSDWFSAVKLGYKFDPEATCPKWMKYLQTSLGGDTERIALLQEWAGYLLSTNNQMQKFIVLEGEGQNGKTVFFAGITAMIGQENISHVSLENFGGRFDLSNTIGKLANICGDVGEVDQVAEGILKQYTGGEIMQFDRKGIQPIQARPTAKLMFAWNNPPRFRDKSKGIWRRLILVPFDQEIKESERIHRMDEAGWWLDSGEVPGILNWAIHGLNRLNAQMKFTSPKVCLDRFSRLRTESNPVIEFLEDNVSPAENDAVQSSEIYQAYRKWCSENGLHALGSSQFGKEIKRAFPAANRSRKRISGQLKWCYEKISFRSEF